MTDSNIVPDKAELLKVLSATSLEDMVKDAEGTKKITFAIIGCGRAGNFHMTSMRAVSEIARLKWVVDSDESRAVSCAEREHCQSSTDASVVFSDPEVDAVIISSVTYTHYQFCKSALQARKAVFTEKPISHKPEELLEIIDMAESSGLPFVVGYQRRVDKNFRELHRQIKAKAVGDIQMIKCCSRDNPLPPLEYLRVSGGIFNDMLCHDFDMIHYLNGGLIPEEVFTTGHCYNEDIKQMDDIDMVAVMLKFSNGLIAMVDCSRTAAYGYDQRVEVFGCLGMASAHNEQETTVVLATADGFKAPCAQWSFPQRYEHTYITEIAEFVALVKAKGVEPREILRRHIDLDRIAASAELSWRLGRPIKLEECGSLRHQLPH